MSQITRFKELIQEFGPRVCITKTVWSATKNIPVIGPITNQIKYNAITDFLYKENRDLIETFNQKQKVITFTIGTDTNIWVFWWQGIEAAPDLVKMCINSIKIHSNGRNVIILDRNNYRNYVQMDSKYVGLVRAGKMTKTQFSDLLRLNLLYQNGGIWFDATYLILEDLSSAVGDLSFWTIRHGMKKEYPMSKGLWTGSAIAFSKGNPVLKLIVDMYDRYYERHDVLIDYLLIDHMFGTCCDHSSLAEKMFKNVPENNREVNNLLSIMNQPYSEDLVKSTVDQTTMNKLSWKIHMMESKNSRETVYGHYLKMYKGKTT
jgi:hypothetical protein